MPDKILGGAARQLAGVDQGDQRGEAGRRQGVRHLNLALLELAENLGHHPVADRLGVRGMGRHRCLEIVGQLARAAEQLGVGGRQGIALDEAGAPLQGRRGARRGRGHPLAGGGQGRQVGLG